MNIKKDLLFVFLLVIYFALQFNELLFQMPNGIHEWAQADRLALAYGFYENGMNFFKPSTLSQFSEGGITGVEFPIQAYVAAGLAKVFGKAYISLIFRLVDTVVIGICLFALYKITATFTKYFALAVLPVVLPLLSPAFLNYTCNYMPDTVAVAILFVGMAQYFQVWFQGKNSKRLMALLLCTLATLIKLSTGIYLIGFVAFDVYRFFKHQNDAISRRYIIKYISGIVICFGIIVGSVIYNRYLNERYSSTLFLMNAKPISFGDFKYYFGNRLPKLWLKEYFIIPAYGLIIGIVITLFRAKNFNSNFKRSMLVLSAILCLGIAAVFYLMGAQFIDHDYYFIPIFLPFVVFLSIAFAIQFDNVEIGKNVQNTLSLVLLGLMIVAYFKTQNRLSPDYPGFSDYYNNNWMQKGAIKLSTHGVSEKEQIVTLNENPPNLSLVYFDRKGYALNKDYWGGSFGWLNQFFEEKHIQYGVAKRSEFENLTAAEPEIFEKYFVLMYKDDKMVLFREK